MNIRDLESADCAKYLTLSKEFYSSSAVDHTISPAHFEETAKQALNHSPYLRVLIIEHEGQIAGYGQISITYSNEAGGLCVWLEELYISPDFQNLKLGSSFIHWVLEEYHGKVRRFRLEITPSNQNAKRLYERLGFTTLEYQQMLLDLPAGGAQ